ncbi:MAG: DUF4446 family protein [Candidatus Sungiibacteriota bacterium]
MPWIYDNQFFILGAVVIAGFSVLGWMVFEMRTRLFRVLGGAHSSGDLTNDLLQRMMRIEHQMETIEPRMIAAEAIAQRAVQKVGFLRFNPFQDTGGDNSFIIVLLDGENTGVMVSSLYMREGTRLYAKAVERGSVRAPLSDEEQKVFTETIEKKAI